MYIFYSAFSTMAIFLFQAQAPPPLPRTYPYLHQLTHHAQVGANKHETRIIVVYEEGARI